MALGKSCPCGKEKAGRNSIYGRNCRRLFKRWGEEKEHSDVVNRDEALTRWHAPVRQRLEEDDKKSKVTVLRKKKVA